MLLHCLSMVCALACAAHLQGSQIGGGDCERLEWGEGQGGCGCIRGQVGLHSLEQCGAGEGDDPVVKAPAEGLPAPECRVEGEGTQTHPRNAGAPQASCLARAVPEGIGVSDRGLGFKL